MEKKKADRKSQRLWRGLTAVTAVFLALAMTGSTIVNGFRTDIDKFLGTTSVRVVTDEDCRPCEGDCGCRGADE